MRGVPGRLGGALIAAATAILILAVSIVPFFTPAYVRFEQNRTDVPAITGFSNPDLDRVVASILGDILVWQGDFDVAVDGRPVLEERERSHMRDVRGVLAGFEIVALLSLVVVVIAARGARTRDARAAIWRAVGRGAKALVVAVVVIGMFVVFAFDAFFEVFHRLFFSAGSYTFDPRTERLVQLFPERFWSETATAIGILAAVLALALAWVAARRAVEPDTLPLWADQHARMRVRR